MRICVDCDTVLVKKVAHGPWPTRCEPCRVEHRRMADAAWWKAHPEMARARAERWRTANPDKNRASHTAWAMANPEKLRANEAAWRKANPERYLATKRATTQRRRARKAAVENTLTTVEETKIRRAATHCSLCGMVLVLGGPIRLRPSLDHTIPISRGGGHTAGNVTVAHHGCNAVKGAR